MIPADVMGKITSKIQPEDLQEAKTELDKLALSGNFYVAKPGPVYDLQVKVYAAGIRAKKDNAFKPVKYVEAPPVDDELTKAIKTEKAIALCLTGRESRYSNISASDPMTRQTEVMKYLFDTFAYSDKHNLMLLGGVGSGKTFGAIAYVGSNANLRYTEHGQPVVNAVFTRAYTISEMLQRKSWSALDEIRAKKWLIIDDLGVEGAGYRSTDFLAFFEDLFIERHQNQRRTIMTCNASVEDVTKGFGERFISRLRETGEIFQTNDDDMRAEG